jgi:hypothetical protein
VGVDWGQILPRQGVWGEATDILSNENTFFSVLKRVAMAYLNQITIQI